MTSLHTRLLTAVVAVASATACRGPSPSVPEPVQPLRTPAIATAQADSARNPYTQADINFMTAMIGHHAQAVEMARWAPAHGASGRVAILAERIINGQQDEIVTMQTWLADRRQPSPESHGMMSHGMMMMMPGMLTEAQMHQLDQSRGGDFDLLFLSFMIQHHRGAVAMVTELFGSYGAGHDDIVFKFASDVNVDQLTEIARMEKMLAARLLEGSPL